MKMANVIKAEKQTELPINVFPTQEVPSDLCGLIKNGWHAQYPKDVFRTKIPVSSSSQVTVPVEYLAQTGA